MADDDTDTSDWDSSLSFTSPNNQQRHDQQPPRITVTDEDADERTISEQVPRPKERTSINSEQHQQHKQMSNAHVTNSSPATRRSTKEVVNTGKISQNYRQSDGNAPVPGDPPPYSFKGQALAESASRKPGKDRKGNIYDPSPSPTPRMNPSTSDFNVGSWDESDEEKTLRELRTNYNKAKHQEQKKQEQLRIKQTEEDAISWRDEEPKSESTWKNITNFGRNSFGIGRSSKNKKAKKISKNENNTTIQTQEAQISKRNEFRVQSGSVPLENNNFIIKHPQIQENLTQTSHSTYQPTATATVNDDQELYRMENSGKRHLYFFGKSDTNVYNIKDITKEAFFPRLADKVEWIFRRIWLEFFGFLRLLISFPLSLLVELLRFIILSIIHPIFIGCLRTFGDFIATPCLSVLFNSYCQPLYICCWNCMGGMKMVCGPLIDIWRSCLEPLATCCLSVKLVQINWRAPTNGSDNQKGLQNVV